MTEPILNINESVLEGVIAKAVIDSITPAQRDKMLAGLVDHLLAKPKQNEPGYDRFGRNNLTNLEVAVQQAVFSTALKVMREELENDPRVRDGVKAALDPTLNAIAMADYSGEIREAMALAVVDVIQKKL